VSAGRWIQYSVPESGRDGFHVAASSEQRIVRSQMTVPFALRGFREGDAQIILLAGELDLAAAGELCLAIDVAKETSARTIVVDLSMLAFIDASGVRGILAARERLNERLILVRGSPAVHRVFELCGLAERLVFVAERPREVEPVVRGGSSPARRSQRDSIRSPAAPVRGFRGEVRRRASQAVLAGAIRSLRSKPPDGNRLGS
jgi:anti-sigma B factor antagonist